MKKNANNDIACDNTHLDIVYPKDLVALTCPYADLSRVPYASNQ